MQGCDVDLFIFAMAKTVTPGRGSRREPGRGGSQEGVPGGSRDRGRYGGDQEGVPDGSRYGPHR